MAQKKTARRVKPNKTADVMPLGVKRPRRGAREVKLEAQGPTRILKTDGPRVLGPGPRKPVDDDLMIFDEAGKFYRIKKKQYLQHKIPNNTPELRELTGQMEFLVEQGVVLADIPLGTLGTVDCACYFINLAGIRHVPSKAERTP
jgi:hypothetical protein